MGVHGVELSVKTKLEIKLLHVLWKKQGCLIDHLF